MKRYFLRLAFIAFCIFIVMPQAGTYLLANLGKINPNDPMSSFTTPQTASKSGEPMLSAARRQHILYGDKTGGGHLHGVGKPCKSEFPADWDASEIEAVLLKTAANDNLTWEEQDNGFSVAEVKEEGIVIRVVVDKIDNEIITGYPVSVPRNPCPTPANDNEK